MVLTHDSFPSDKRGMASSATFSDLAPAVLVFFRFPTLLLVSGSDDNFGFSCFLLEDLGFACFLSEDLDFFGNFSSPIGTPVVDGFTN
jgi:hypothetical protein